MEPTNGIEPLNLFLTKEALYRLSYVGDLFSGPFFLLLALRWVNFKFKNWSGRRDSNSRHPAWKAEALPTELLPLIRLQALSPTQRLAVKTTKKAPLILQKTPAGSHVVINDPDLLPKSPTYALSSGWWWGEDSNLRRLRRQIYSLFPLAAREPHLLIIVNFGRKPANRAIIICRHPPDQARALMCRNGHYFSATVIFSPQLQCAVS